MIDLRECSQSTLAGNFMWPGFGQNMRVLDAIQSVTPDEVRNELLSQEELFLTLAGDLPKEMIFQRELLVSRL